jgi:ribosomal protein L2
VPVSRVLMDVPYAMTVANIRTELGGEFAMARLAGRVTQLFGAFRRRQGPTAGAP